MCALARVVRACVWRVFEFIFMCVCFSGRHISVTPLPIRIPNYRTVRFQHRSVYKAFAALYELALLKVDKLWTVWINPRTYRARNDPSPQ